MTNTFMFADVLPFLHLNMAAGFITNNVYTWIYLPMEGFTFQSEKVSQQLLRVD